MATNIDETVDRAYVEIGLRAVYCREWLERLVRAQCKQKGLSSRVAAILARKLYKRIPLHDKAARYLSLAYCYVNHLQTVRTLHRGHPQDVAGIPAHCGSLDGVMYMYGKCYASIYVNGRLYGLNVNIFRGVARKNRK
jgi:hypothetical protein